MTVTVGWLVGLTSEPPQSAGCRAALVQVNGEPTVDAGAVAWTEKTTCSPPSSLAELEFAVTLIVEPLMLIDHALPLGVVTIVWLPKAVKADGMVTLMHPSCVPVVAAEVAVKV